MSPRLFKARDESDTHRIEAAQPILLKRGIGTTVWVGAKSITSGELNNEYRITNKASGSESLPYGLEAASERMSKCKNLINSALP
jgi:hypothetical protein